MRKRGDGPNYEVVEVTFRRSSEHAVLVSHDGDEQWVPLSCLADDDAFADAEAGDELEVEVAAWTGRDRGWSVE